MDAREVAAKEEEVLREIGSEYKVKFSYHKKGWDVFSGKFLILKNQPDIDKDLVVGAIEELEEEIREFGALQMNFVSIAKQTKKRELKSESVYVNTILYGFLIAGNRWDYTIQVSEEEFDAPLRPVELLIRKGIKEVAEECDKAIQEKIIEEPILRVRNLVGEIRSICEDHGLPFFFSVVRSNSEAGTEYFSDFLSPADVEEKLKDDRIGPEIKIMLGYQAVLPTHVKDFLVDEEGDSFFLADSGAEADSYEDFPSETEESPSENGDYPFDYD